MTDITAVSEDVLETGSPSAQPSRIRLLKAYLLLTPLLIVPVSTSQFLGAVDFLAPFTLLLILASVNSRISFPSIWLILFIGTSIFSAAWALADYDYDSLDPLLIIRMYLIYLPFLLVTSMNHLGSKDILSFYKYFLVGGSVSCLIGIVLYQAGIQTRDTQQMNWYGQGVDASIRAGGLLGNSGDFGHLAAILGTVAIGFAILVPVRRSVPIFIFLLAAYATYASSSRAAMLHLAVAVLLMTPALLRGRRLATFLVMAPTAFLTMALFAPTLVISPQTEFIFRRLDVFNITGETLFYSSESRVNAWEQVFQLFKNDPFSGIGYGMIVPLTGRAGDNSFVTVLVETGIISGLAYIAFWVSLLVSIWLSARGALRIVGIGVVLSEMAHMLTVDTHSMWATTPVALIFIACLLRLSWQQRVEPSND